MTTPSTSTQMRAGHAGLVLPPLFLTMMFCFGLVFVQQQQARSRTAAAKEAYNNKAHTKLSPSSFQTAAPLTPIVVAPPSKATKGTANPKVGAPAQPSKTSGAAVQAASPNTVPGNSIIPVVAQPVNRATHLLGL